MLLRAAATGRLEEFGALHWSRSAAVNVVLAAQGYPSAPVVGDPIGGLDELVEEGAVTVLHAGRRLPSGELVSSGGRVLNILALGTTSRRAGRHTGSCAGRAARVALPHRHRPLRKTWLTSWITRKTHL